MSDDQPSVDSQQAEVLERMAELCQVARRAVGGTAAVILQRDIEHDRWQMLVSVEGLSAALLEDAPILLEVWNRNQEESLCLSSSIREGDRHLLEVTDAQCLLIAPINAEGHTWGLFLVFVRQDSAGEEDLRLVIILARQSGDFLVKRALLERMQGYLAQLERSLGTVSALNETSRRLLAAKGYDQILEAVLSYAAENGAARSSLLSIDLDEAGQPEWLTVIAFQEVGAPKGSALGTRYRVSDVSLSPYWMNEPDDVQLVEDVSTDPRYDAKTRETSLRYGTVASVLMPLTINGEWVGLLTIIWREPHAFSSIDRQYYKSLAALMTNAMENERLRAAEQEAMEKLTRAYRELETFSYSVSHDLRTPLRAMNGYSQALEEDYAPQLDAIARKYLARIRASSEHMGELIDDLIELSQWSRSEMKQERVDLSATAQHIASELQQHDRQRQVTFVIEDGLVATADARLLAVVLSNLLSNAWKYTGKQSQPQIEFGAVEQQGRLVYFVRDNGAGFDMTYIHKLFGVFQRLHTDSDFPGNGIGLATVRRIIERHGGKIWAEGVVDQGATFYFTLPE